MVETFTHNYGRLDNGSEGSRPKYETFVRYSDYAVLKAENERLTKERDYLTALVQEWKIKHLHAERALAERAGGVKHVAYFDDGQFYWMSGIAPRNCELYTLTTEQSAPEGQQETGLAADEIPRWPPLKKTLWDVVTGENLNDGHYINAYELTDKLYEAARPAEQAVTEEMVDAARKAWVRHRRYDFDAAMKAALTAALAQEKGR